ncbi:MAG TPA: Cof-type HAD-IIB family hydrolase [Candidatus Enterenecus avicola]|nr:Cof-type HAD-IIB family hydrolase [Candidatus Enterenecus avicola]
MIRAIFFDIDGTMVSYRNKIMSPKLRDDLMALQQAGILIFVCSGRAPQDLKSTGMLRDVAFDGYVTVNGQCCYNAQGVYRDNPVPREDLQAALEVLGAHEELAALVEENGVSYLTCHNQRVDEVFEFLHTKQYPVMPAQRMVEHKVYQFIPLVNKEEEHLFVSVMPGCSYTRWHPLGIDVTAKGEGKADGIRATMAHYGLKPEETMAFGDGENDLTMLALVGTAVAMGGADERVKACAHYVTDTVEEEGISKALRHFSLLPPERI